MNQGDEATDRPLMRKIASLVIVGLASALCTANLSAGTLKATFANGSLNAIEGNSSLTFVGNGSGATPIDSVYGQDRTVYRWGVGQDILPVNQTGLTLNPNGLFSRDSYSIEMVVKFKNDQGPNVHYIRVLDTSNRTSDNGLYVSPGGGFPVLQLFGSGAVKGQPSGPFVTYDAFHHIVITNNTTDVKAYVDGTQVFSTTSTELQIPTNGVLGFFLDNNNDITGTEYAGGNLALLRVYDGVPPFGDKSVADLFAFPFNGVPLNGASVPEPSMLGLMGLAGLGLCGFLWRRRSHVWADAS